MFIKEGKWDWPIAKKIKDYYGANGLLKTIAYIILIILGVKIVVINGAIWLLNLFGAGIEYAPILKTLGVL
jgi:hypothetical protein|tara:strand:+ start:255 stop:467 length:213 start_codon:yes stop_codon:yes gene_type:complete